MNDFDALLVKVKREAKKIGIPISDNIDSRIAVNTRAKTRYGRCTKKGNSFVIELSSILIDAPEISCRQTIAHELIHTCPGCMDHGDRFRYYASKMNKFCSKKCSAEYKHRKIIDAWKNEEYKGNPESIPKAIRKYLLEKSNYKCEECGFEGYNKLTNKTILQIHHKDGDSSNNSESNLQVLCPNCHAMTETFSNCGKRKSSRIRYDSKTYYFEKFKKEHNLI
jgi:5-methylcytosine-specific restriction endonuclease McrA